MNRAEMRRQQRESKKALRKSKLPAPLFLGNKTPKQMAEMTGARIESIEAWTQIQRDEIIKEYEKEFNEKLFQAEDYVALVNILITIVALHMTWGYTKAIGNFLKNWNAANGYVKRNGVKKVFEQVNKEYGLDLEFDDFEIEGFIQECEKCEGKA